jgi:hypothetical protein
MRQSLVALVAFMLITTAGCYHATVETGLTPSNEVIRETFASSWVYGLVPPKAIDAKLKCTHGVARVETQLSFVNQLVGFLTLGIYTPMEITVTCAASSAMGERAQPDIIVDERSVPPTLQDALQHAADMTVRTGKPVFIKY